MSRSYLVSVRDLRRRGQVIYEDYLIKSRCAAGNCPVMVSLGRPYCKTHLRLRMGLEIKDSDHLLRLGLTGRGVYATRAFQYNELIAKYECERVDVNELERRYGSSGVHVYTLDDEAGDGRFPDGLRDRWVATMINDCRGGEAGANVAFITAQPMEIRATRYIAGGEELLIDYGDQYWRGFRRSKIVISLTPV